MTTSDQALSTSAIGAGFTTAFVKEGPPRPPITMAFPFYAGPGSRGLATILLYRAKVFVSIPSLFDKEQYAVFRKVGDVALKKGLPCIEAFVLADHHFRLAVRQSEAERQNLAPLALQLEFTQIINDASPAWYDASLKKLDSVRLSALQSAFADVQQLNVAGREFIWRVFSAHLEFDGDPIKVVDHLEQHRKAVGSTHGLLAQTLFNRYMLIGDGPSSVTAFATKDERTARILSHLAKEASSRQGSVEARADLLGFLLFDNLLSGHIGLLVPPNVERIARLFSDREQELTSMRERCRREATALVSESMNAVSFVSLVMDKLRGFREEVGALLEMTESTFARMVRSLTENGTFWSSILGLAGTVVGDVGAVVPAAVGVTVVGQVAATAMKATNERRDALKSSPWSFVYYAKQAK